MLLRKVTFLIVTLFSFSSLRAEDTSSQQTEPEGPVSQQELEKRQEEAQDQIDLKKAQSQKEAEAIDTTPSEQADVSDRLDAFFSAASDEERELQMNRPVRKWSVSKQRFKVPSDSKVLKFSEAHFKEIQDRDDGSEREGISKHPLKESAGVKLSGLYNKFYCERFLKARIPDVDCGAFEKQSFKSGTVKDVKSLPGRAAEEYNDKVADLTDTWIAKEDLIENIEDLPTAGRTDIPIWSDDYWAIKNGVTSFRYNWGNNDVSTWKSAINGYSQPGTQTARSEDKLEWHGLLERTPLVKLNGLIGQIWAPSEKYDLSVGDTSFSLTKAQKEEGRGYWESYGKVESWMGICHGWAPASYMMTPMVRTANFAGADGSTVKWFPHDIAAIASLNWAKGRYRTNFVGGRCNSKDARLLPNKRLAQQECFDTNPSTFLKALGNMVGAHGYTFVMDKTFDYEVWNQAVTAYSIKYFNVERMAKARGRYGRRRVKRYNDFNRNKNRILTSYSRFKRSKKDIFSKNKSYATRGVRGFRGYDDSKIKYLVGFEVTVEYAVEIEPSHRIDLYPTETDRVTYIGDLELAEVNGKLEITGGEWYENAHPDFLWTPQKTAVATRAGYDVRGLKLSEPGKAINPNLTRAAVTAATPVERRGNQIYDGGYPLCGVVQSLVNATKPRDFDHPVNATYECRL